VSFRPFDSQAMLLIWMRSEQLQSDIEAANANVAEARSGVDKLQRELVKLQDQVTEEVCHFGSVLFHG
jgi:site-specific recombinase